MQRLARSLGATRSYATRGPRPKPGTSERPPYRAPEPLKDNPHATVTVLSNELTFIRRPPPTAPSPFSLTTNPVSPLLRPATKVTGAPLPPPSRLGMDKMTPKKRHVSEETVEKIRALRRSKPEEYTRGKVASMFGVSQNFVGLVASLSSSKRKAALKTREEAHARERKKWSERHQLVKAIRQKRREFW